MGDSVTGNFERWVSNRQDDRVVTSLPGVKFADITCCVDRPLASVEMEPVIIVHVVTNNMRKCSPKVLEE